MVSPGGAGEACVDPALSLLSLKTNFVLLLGVAYKLTWAAPHKLKVTSGMIPICFMYYSPIPSVFSRERPGRWKVGGNKALFVLFKVIK